MHGPRRAAILLSAASAATAVAQTGQYRLDPQGNWVAIEAAPLSGDAKIMADARQLLADGKAGQAESMLNDWIAANEHGDSPLLARAYLLRADAIALGGNEYRALYDYERLIKDFPGSEEFPRAVERELEIGVRYVHGLERRLFGFRWVDASDVGEELLVRVQERMPGSPLAERAAIELADYYYRVRDLRMASDAYEIFVRQFPRSEQSAWARQRRIYASIARFKGPAYDATGLRDAKVLIEEYAEIDPAGAQRTGLSDAMVARLDESMAAQMLQKSRWYLKRGDSVSARFILRRLTKEHPETVSAGTARTVLTQNGWTLEPPADKPPETPAPEPAATDPGAPQ
jgi:outer membrane protein assembly factor BamD (BamD/ComL family)